jgi:hypothetical protein
MYIHQSNRQYNTKIQLVQLHNDTAGAQYFIRGIMQTENQYNKRILSNVFYINYLIVDYIYFYFHVT